MSDIREVNGRRIDVPDGASIAAAALNAGITVFRTSVGGESRGPLCGIGICHECRARVDGKEHERTCQMFGTESADNGVSVSNGGADILVCHGRAFLPGQSSRQSHGSRTVSGGQECPPLDHATADTNVCPTDHLGPFEQQSFDVVIIGAGPAGLAAASAVAPHASVAIIDDNAAAGGQIWRGEEIDDAIRLDRSVRFQLCTTVIASPSPNALLVESPAGARTIHYSKLILATGARERFLPFPGWTSRRVLGVGGLQALVKSGLKVEGRRIILAGSGPLLLPAASTLKKHGASVRLIAEQARRRDVIRFATSLLLEPSKLAQAFRYQFELLEVPLLTGAWPTSVVETSAALEVTLHTPDGPRVESCDWLAAGFFLVPNLELPRLLGCDCTGGVVEVDEHQCTSVADVHAAGEITGVGGLEKSLIEGRIAGLCAIGRAGEAAALLSSRQRALRFAQRLAETFALRDELRRMVTDDTIVCRCEDVPFAQIRSQESFRAARLLSRCGMGPCQGRVCGSAVEFLTGWRDASVRPPVVPCEVASLACPS